MLWWKDDGGRRMQLVSIRLRVAPERREEILATIRRFLEPTSVEPGCLGIRCLRDAWSENSLVIEERWATREDLESHVRSSDYRSTLALLESAAEKPTVEFHEVANTSGMELIESIIGRAGRG
jgi:quinol monooxygenase YgiN